MLPALRASSIGAQDHVLVCRSQPAPCAGAAGTPLAPLAQMLQYGSVIHVFPSCISLSFALMFSLTLLSSLGQIFCKYIFSPKSCFPSVGLMYNKLFQCLIYKAYEVSD